MIGQSFATDFKMSRTAHIFQNFPLFQLRKSNTREKDVGRSAVGVIGTGFGSQVGAAVPHFVETMGFAADRVGTKTAAVAKWSKCSTNVSTSSAMSCSIVCFPKPIPLQMQP